jgi:hypothetical protein
MTGIGGTGLFFIYATNDRDYSLSGYMSIGTLAEAFNLFGLT